MFASYLDQFILRAEHLAKISSVRVVQVGLVIFHGSDVVSGSHGSIFFYVMIIGVARCITAAGDERGIAVHFYMIFAGTIVGRRRIPVEHHACRKVPPRTEITGISSVYVKEIPAAIDLVVRQSKIVNGIGACTYDLRGEGTVERI